MDDKRFDLLTRAFASNANRRSLIKGLLGLGGAAAIGTAVEEGAEAARRTTPTPVPHKCPGVQYWDGSACVCPTNLTQCVPGYGPACCNDQGPVGPGYSECCDDACCHYPNQCTEEELCCPRLPEVACVDAQGNCCSTLCQITPGGVECCPAGDFCPGGGGSADLCCGGNTSCCGGGTSANHCIPGDRICCSTTADCAYLDSCDGLIWNHHVCGEDGYCVDDPVDCNDGKPCTTDTCDDRTGCHQTAACTDPGVCEKGPGSCNEAGQCVYPPLCSGDTPRCCQGESADYCIASTQTCCQDNEDCTGPCAICGTGGYCVTACTGSETCCGDDCVDLNNDNDNCGACGHRCTGCATCSEGQCVAGDTCLSTCQTCEVNTGTGVGTCEDTCPGCGTCTRSAITGNGSCQPDNENCKVAGEICCPGGGTFTCETGPNCGCDDNDDCAACFDCVVVIGTCQDTCDPTNQECCRDLGEHGTCVSTTPGVGCCSTEDCDPGETCIGGTCNCAGEVCDGGDLCCVGDKPNCCTDVCVTGNECCTDGECDPGETCIDGTCNCAGEVCADGRLCCIDPMPDCCGDVCVDFQSDNENCGACGTVCEGCTTCQSGICKPNNNECTGGKICCPSGVNDGKCEEGPYCGCDDDDDCTQLNNDATCTRGHCDVVNGVGTCVPVAAPSSVVCHQAGDSVICDPEVKCNGTATGCPIPNPPYPPAGTDCGDCETCDGHGLCVDRCPTGPCRPEDDFCADQPGECCGPADCKPKDNCTPAACNGHTCNTTSVCDAGETCCGNNADGCVDLQTDNQNCGSCGNDCEGCSTCQDGVCKADNAECRDATHPDRVCCPDGNSFTCEEGPYCGCDNDDDCGPCERCNHGICEPFCTDGTCCPQASPAKDYCIPKGETCCTGNDKCTVPCEVCDTQLGYCVSDCDGDAQCCTEGGGEECCLASECLDGFGCCPVDDQCGTTCCDGDKPNCCTDHCVTGNECCINTDCDPGETCIDGICNCAGTTCDTICCVDPKPDCCLGNPDFCVDIDAGGCCDNGDCTGSCQICDPSTHTCTADPDCCPGGCTGDCEQCVDGDCVGCSGSAPYCRTSDETCVECLSAGDCPPGPGPGGQCADCDNGTCVYVDVCLDSDKVCCQGQCTAADADNSTCPICLTSSDCCQGCCHYAPNWSGCTGAGGDHGTPGQHNGSEGHCHIEDSSFLSGYPCACRSDAECSSGRICCFDVKRGSGFNNPPSGLGIGVCVPSNDCDNGLCLADYSSCDDDDECCSGVCDNPDGEEQPDCGGRDNIRGSFCLGQPGSACEDDECCRSGNCSSGQCTGGSGFARTSSVEDCIPGTCKDIGWGCGQTDDGCGGPLDCGTCPDGGTCDEKSHQCVVTCVSQTCADQQAVCGTIDDGCGAKVDCGICSDGSSCDDASHQCIPNCTPVTCAELGAACGAPDDGCGTALDCGPCQDGYLCDESTWSCISACTPQTCAGLGVVCGTWDDGCGAPLDCGACTDYANSYCTDAGQCACTPLDCTTVDTCGTDLADGCGSLIDCPCAAAQVTCKTDGDPCEQGVDVCCNENSECSRVPRKRKYACLPR